MYQYPASIPAVSMNSPVTVDINGMSPERGRTGASNSAKRPSIRSTCAECDA